MPVSDPTLAELAGLLRRLADEMQFGGSLENDPMAFINKARAFAEAIEGNAVRGYLCKTHGFFFENPEDRDAMEWQHAGRDESPRCPCEPEPLYAFPANAPKEELE